MRRAVDRLRDEQFDIVVIGAGAHGAWVALRASRAGYRVALIDKGDLAAGTSSNSLNILHGGLRYLQHLDFARMRMSIRARREFARRAGHLVAPLSCLLPLQATGVRSPWILGPALLANDIVSMDRNSDVDESVRLPMGRLIPADACETSIGKLVEGAPAGGAIWWDLISLDSARLLIDVVHEASDLGSAVATRVQALRYLMANGKTFGVSATDTLSGEEFDIRAAVVVNATGPWAGCLSRASGLPCGYLPAAWTGGLNVVLGRPLGIPSAVALSAASGPPDAASLVRRQRRELFFVPWRGVAMVGTDYVRPEEAEHGDGLPPRGAVERFVSEIAEVAPRARLTPADVAMTHWGILPAESQNSLLPSKTPIVAAGRERVGIDGLVVVIGEKLTSAPVVSEKVLGLCRAQLGHEGDRTVSARQLDGDGRSRSAEEFGSLPQEIERRLAARYGVRWGDVAKESTGRSDLLEPVHPCTEVLRLEIVYAIRHEMAMTLEDLLLRRVGIGAVGYPGDAVTRACALVAGAELKWSPSELASAIAAVNQWYAARVPARRPTEVQA